MNPGARRWLGTLVKASLTGLLVAYLLSRISLGEALGLLAGASWPGLFVALLLASCDPPPCDEPVLQGEGSEGDDCITNGECGEGLACIGTDACGSGQTIYIIDLVSG